MPKEPRFEEYELPLVERYIAVNSPPQNNEDQYNNTTHNQSLIKRLNYQNYIPKFMMKSTRLKVFYYIGAILCFGILGIWLRVTFDLDFNEYPDNNNNDDNSSNSGGGGEINTYTNSLYDVR